MTKQKIKTVTYLFIIIFICFLAAPLFFTSSFLNKLNDNSTSMDKSPYPSVFELNDEDKLWIENKIEELTLREKVAQMVTVLVPANRSEERRVGKASRYRE